MITYIYIDTYIYSRLQAIYKPMVAKNISKKLVPFH